MSEYLCWIDRCRGELNSEQQSPLHLHCSFRVVYAANENEAVAAFMTAVLPSDTEFNGYLADPSNAGFASNFGDTVGLNASFDPVFRARVIDWFQRHPEFGEAYLSFLEKKQTGQPADAAFPPGFFEFVARKIGRAYVDIGCVALDRLRE